MPFFPLGHPSMALLNHLPPLCLLMCLLVSLLVFNSSETSILLLLNDTNCVVSSPVYDTEGFMYL